MKNIIKSGGEWIVSLDIENLLSLHEDIAEAALIGVPDVKWAVPSHYIFVRELPKTSAGKIRTSWSSKKSPSLFPIPL